MTESSDTLTDYLCEILQTIHTMSEDDRKNNVTCRDIYTELPDLDNAKGSTSVDACRAPDPRIRPVISRQTDSDPNFHDRRALPSDLRIKLSQALARWDARGCGYSDMLKSGKELADALAFVLVWDVSG